VIQGCTEIPVFKGLRDLMVLLVHKVIQDFRVLLDLKV
jgi:hypothetical protein